MGIKKDQIQPQKYYWVIGVHNNLDYKIDVKDKGNIILGYL